MRKSFILITVLVFILCFAFVFSVGSAPGVILNTPMDYYNLTSPNVTFSFNATDLGGANFTCNITVDGVVRVSDILALNDTATTNSTTIATEGNHLWNASCWNSTGTVINTSVTRNVRVDLYAPLFGASSVNASSVAAGETVRIYANFTDVGSGIAVSNLFVNGANVSQNNTVIGLATSVNYTYIFQTNISHIGTNISFIVNATDFVGRSNLSTNMTIHVTDNVPPSLAISAPTNGYNSSSASVVFTFTTSDSYYDSNSSVNCTLSIDGSTWDVKNDTTGTSITGTMVNGTHFYNLTCIDYGENQNNTFINRYLMIDTVEPTVAGISVANGSNVSATTAIVINYTDAYSGVTSSNYTVSGTSCSVSSTNFTNATSFIAFNSSAGCRNAEENVTVSLTLIDHAGNTFAENYLYVLDNVGPTVTVTSPVSGTNYTSVVNLTYSAADLLNDWHTVGYFLDSNGIVILSGNNSIVLSPGEHTLKYWANDTQGNEQNTSPITFRITDGSFNLSQYAEDIIAFVGANQIKNVTFWNSSDDIIIGNVSIGRAITIKILSNSTGNDINTTLAISNGTSAVWTANFSMDSNNASSAANVLANNWSTRIKTMVRFDSNIDSFLPSYSSYYGSVLVPYNISNSSLATNVWWFANESVPGTVVFVSACTGVGKTSVYSASETTPCFNVTDDGNSMVYLPHFSAVAVAYDDVNVSLTLLSPNITSTLSTFVLNVSSSLDASACTFTLSYNSSLDGSSVGGISNNGGVSGTMTNGSTANYCTYGPSNFRNGNYTLNISIRDGLNNANFSSQTITVLDVTDPILQFSQTNNISASTTSATINLGSNEWINATLNYGTGTSMGSYSYSSSTAGYATSFSLSGLTAETDYYFNLTICDYAGNCVTNGSYSFNTSATSSSTTTSSSSGSTAGGNTPASDDGTIASFSKSWDKIVADEQAIVNINNLKIAVDKINITLNKQVDNPSMDVSSITKPSDVSAIDDFVYQYLEIKATKLTESVIKTAKIRFSIPFTWFNENKIKRDDVRMYRYDSGWKLLGTVEVTSDSKNAYYEATTPGFSYFVIAAKKEATQGDDQGSEGESGGALGDGTGGDAGTTKGEDGTGDSTGDGSFGKSWIWWVIAIIIIAAAVSVYFFSRKNDDDKEEPAE